MVRTIRAGPYTFDDFCFLVKDGQKGDLINGVIYLAPPEEIRTNDQFMWLAGLLGGVAEETEQGHVYGSRVAFRLGDRDGPEPDLSFVRRDRRHLARPAYFDGPPDLALEIVEAESVERDYRKKRVQYEQAGVTEYWIIDEMEQKVTLLRLGKTGTYREVKPRQGELSSAVLRGFWLRPEWLWQEKLPSNLDVLQQLLDRFDPPPR